jgi:hypothetical protein
VRRLTELAAIAAVASLGAASLAPAQVGKGDDLGFSRGVTTDFRTRAMNCIREYESLGGLALQVFRGVYDSPATIALQPPSGGGHESFALSAIFKPTGGHVIKIEWWPFDRGSYALDGAPQVPCAILLHEMRHAWDFATGKIGGASTDELNSKTLHNPTALRQVLYTEGLGVRAENYYLWRHRLRQRRRYGLFRLTKCVAHPRSKGVVYLQGCYGAFNLPRWVAWR